jgi:hypothetical protein
MCATKSWEELDLRLNLRSIEIRFTPFDWGPVKPIVQIPFFYRKKLGPFGVSYWVSPTNAEINAMVDERNRKQAGNYEQA